MQLMLGVYEFPGEAGGTRSATRYPKELTVDHVRGYRRVEQRAPECGVRGYRAW